MAGQQFKSDKLAAVVLSRLRYLTRISLWRALMHWFPVGTYASVEAIIMWQNCVCVCACACACARAHAPLQCYSGSFYSTLRTSLMCPLELSHLQSVQKPGSWSLKYWFIWPPWWGCQLRIFLIASVNWKEKTVMHFWGYLPWTNAHLLQCTWMMLVHAVCVLP